MFDEADGSEYIFHHSIIILFVVLIQPQVINHHEYPFHPFSSDQIQERSDVCEYRQYLILYNTISLLIHCVELSTLLTFIFGLVTRLTLFTTILNTNLLIINKLIFHTITAYRITCSSIKFVSTHTGSTVVGESATNTL